MVDARSNKVRGRVALRIPTPMPPISQSSTPPITSDSVAGRPCLMIVVTGSWE